MLFETTSEAQQTLSLVTFAFTTELLFKSRRIEESFSCNCSSLNSKFSAVDTPSISSSAFTSGIISIFQGLEELYFLRFSNCAASTNFCGSFKISAVSALFTIE